MTTRWIGTVRSATSRALRPPTTCRMLDLLPEFRAMPDRADLYLRLDTHFSAYGHAVTAAAIARYLEDGGYVTKP